MTAEECYRVLDAIKTINADIGERRDLRAWLLPAELDPILDFAEQQAKDRLSELRLVETSGESRVGHSNGAAHSTL